MLKEIGLIQLIEEASRIPLVVVICPNYEERSIHFIKEIVSNSDKATIYPVVLYLQNRNNNNELLDGLKDRYYNELRQDIHIDNIYIKIDFPDNYSATAIEAKLKKRLKTYFNNVKKFNVLIDITSMPGQLIFTLCDIHRKLIEENTFGINKVLFSYVSPNSHSTVQYAQDVGMLYSFFSEQPLEINEDRSVCSIIFPSRSGHEGKLLLDYLNSRLIEHRTNIFFSIDSNDYLDSLEIMRANQTLLNSHESEIKYYCSLMDGIRRLLTQIDVEIAKLKKHAYTKGQLYLVAPFSPKIILPVAYYALKRIERLSKELGIDVEIEICHTKGFQYTSVYSLGIGNLSIYEVNLEDYNGKS
ncbi:hypothetical protein, partial [Pseudobacteroides cellulosolvens]